MHLTYLNSTVAAHENALKSRSRRVVLNGLTLLFVLGSTVCSAQRYNVTDLGSFGNGFAHARGLNDKGEVSGIGFIPYQVAFKYSGGVMSALDAPVNSSSTALAINNRGDVLYHVLADGRSYTVLSSNGIQTELPLSANGINDLGQIVGVVSGDNTFHSVLYHDGIITDLSDALGSFAIANVINNSGMIAGGFSFTSSLSSLGFLYSNSSLKYFVTLGGSYTFPVDINNEGAVVGSSGPVGSAVYHAFLYEKGTIRDLGSLQGGGRSAAFGINDDGLIVGDAWTLDNQQRPFLYENGKMTDLNELVNLPNDVLSEARAINNRGQIIANSGNKAYLLTPVSTAVPEPSSYGASASALAIGAACWRKRLRRTRELKV